MLQGKLYRVDYKFLAMTKLLSESLSRGQGDGQSIHRPQLILFSLCGVTGSFEGVPFHSITTIHTMCECISYLSPSHLSVLPSYAKQRRPPPKPLLKQNLQSYNYMYLSQSIYDSPVKGMPHRNRANPNSPSEPPNYKLISKTFPGPPHREEMK